MTGAKAEYCYQSYKKTGRPTGEVRCQRQVWLAQPASVIRNLRIKSDRGKNKIRSWRKRTCCSAENGIKFCKRWRFFVPKRTVLSFLRVFRGWHARFAHKKFSRHEVCTDKRKRFFIARAAQSMLSPFYPSRIADTATPEQTSTLRKYGKNKKER